MSAKTLKAAGETRKRNVPKAERVAEASNNALVTANAIIAEAEAEAVAEQAEAVAEAAEAAEVNPEVLAYAESVLAEVAEAEVAEAAEAKAAEAEAAKAKAKAEAMKAEAIANLESEAKAAARMAWKSEAAELRLIVGKLRSADMQLDNTAILTAAEVAAAARKTLRENTAIYKTAVDVLYSWFFAFALSIAPTETEKRKERHRKARAKCVVAIGIAPDNTKGSDYNAIRARIDYYGKQLLLTTVDPRDSMTDDMSMEKWIAESPKIWESVTTAVATMKAAEAAEAEAKAAAEAAAVEAMKAELNRFRSGKVA